MASPSPADTGQTSRSRYEALSTDRQPYLDRARDCSALTLPYLIPRDDTPDGKKLKARAKICPQSARKTHRNKYPVSCNVITQKGGGTPPFLCLAHHYIHHI